MVAISPQKLVLAGAAALLAVIAAPAFGGHAPERQEAALSDGGLRTHESFKTNYYIYKSVGGETEILGKTKKRRWWCVWLCKTRVAKKAETITVHNIYYHEIQPGVFATVEDFKTCTNASSCMIRHWSVGAMVKIKFDSGGVGGPAGAGGAELEIEGVVSAHEATVDGETFTATTAVGKHPPPVIL
jgi:hypothetical protein